MTKIKLFSTDSLFVCGIEARPVFLRLAQRLDAPNTVSISESSETKNQTLTEKLEAQKEKERKERMSKSESAINRIAETLDVEIEQAKEQIHELIEAHRKEVGTAVKIGKKYLLVHASTEATRLILKHESGISEEKLKEVLDELDIKYSAEMYTKDKIPTARPISEMMVSGTGVESAAYENNPKSLHARQEWDKKNTFLSSRESSQSQVLSADQLFRGKAKKYERLLQTIYPPSSEVTQEVKSGWGFSRFGGISNITKIERGGKDKTSSIKERGLWVGDKVTFHKEGVPEDIQRLFGLKEQVDLKDQEAMREFRRASTEEFEQKINEKIAEIIAENQPTKVKELKELLAAFKILDVTYGRQISQGKDSMERLAALNRQTENIPQLFEEEIGSSLGWESLYRENNFPEENNGKRKKAVKGILEGGEVFMLRVDQQKNGKKLKSSIDRSDGSAWASSIDAPQKLRGDSEYTYRYLKIPSGESTAILKKFFKKPGNEIYQEILQSDYKNDLVEFAKCFEVARVEIPNCENPAIVVKPLLSSFEIGKKPPLPQKKEKNVAIVRKFSNVPGGWSLVLRPLDLFAGKHRKNLRADPAILALTGKTLRKSEYVNAEKRTKVRLKKHLGGRIDDILSWRDGSLDKYLNKEINLNNKEFARSILVNQAVESFRTKMEKFNKTASGKNAFDLFQERMKIRADWKESLKEGGYDSKMINVAELLYDEQMKDCDVLKEQIKREKTAYDLLVIKKDWKNELNKDFNTFFTEVKDHAKSRRGSRSSGPKQRMAKVQARKCEKFKSIMKELGVNLENRKIGEVIDEVIDEKLNVQSPPEFVGNMVVFTPTVDTNNQEKLVLHDALSSSAMKEFINVQSPLGHMIQLATMLSGYVVYIKTGVGTPDDLLEKYLQSINASDDEKKEFEKLFKNPEDFEELKTFLQKGKLKGGRVVSVPVNEIKLLIPSWKVLTGLFEHDGGCSVKGIFRAGETPDPPPPSDF